MREYTITVYAPGNNKITDYQGQQIYEPIFLGWYGEDKATELTVNLPSDWTGSFYLDWKTVDDSDFVESETAYTDTEITYDVESDYVVTGDVYLRIRIVDGDTTEYCDPIKFMVRL